MTIRTKLFLSILLILLASYSTIIFTTINRLDSFVEEEVKSALEEHLQYARKEYLDRSKIITYSFSNPVSAPPFQERLRRGDRAWLKDALKRWHTNLPFVDILTVVDANQRVLARVNSDRADDRFELNDLVAGVFREKKPAVSTELVPSDILERERPADAGLPHRKDGEVMAVMVIFPVVDANGSVLGGVITGDIINNDRQLPQQIHGLFEDETEVIFTQRGYVIASTLQGDVSNYPSLGPNIMEMVDKGIPYRGDVTIGSKKFKMAFEPLVNSKGETVGSLSVALSRRNYQKVLRQYDRNIITSAFVSILLSFGIAFLAARTLTKPLKALSQGVQKIEMGDLNQQVIVTTGDEFGMLADSFNRMAKALSERDGTIRKKTLDLQELNEQLETKVAERTAELRMEMGRLEAILTSMAEGIVVTDKDNRVILFNPAAQRLFDLVPHRVLQKPIEEVCDLGSFCIIADFIRDIQTEANHFHLKEEELSVKGKRLKVSLSPVLDEPGNFAGVVMSIRDVTVEGEVDRMKTEFISTVSHELKTPLTSMKGSLQFILNKGKWLTGTERELLTICMRNTERLIRLINDILDISKIEAGRVEFNLKPQSIGELVVYSIEEIKSFSMSRDVSIVNSVGEDIPFVYGDHDRLVQVITNLLSNAVKFSPSGKVVMVSARREGNYVTVSVADHGREIQWSDRDKLFKKFQQLDRGDSAERGGTGLGLAICKEIVEKHHGKISYETGVTGGNVFMFTVPVYEEHL